MICSLTTALALVAGAYGQITAVLHTRLGEASESGTGRWDRGWDHEPWPHALTSLQFQPWPRLSILVPDATPHPPTAPSIQPAMCPAHTSPAPSGRYRVQCPGSRSESTDGSSQKEPQPPCCPSLTAHPGAVGPAPRAMA